MTAWETLARRSRRFSTRLSRRPLCGPECRQSATNARAREKGRWDLVRLPWRSVLLPATLALMSRSPARSQRILITALWRCIPIPTATRSFLPSPQVGQYPAYVTAAYGVANIIGAWWGDNMVVPASPSCSTFLSGFLFVFLALLARRARHVEQLAGRASEASFGVSWEQAPSAP